MNPASANPSSLKLFVGQIPKSLDEAALRPFFEPYGNLLEVAVIRDKATGTHKGCAFVTYSTRAEAENAMQNLHNVKKIPPMQNSLQVKVADGEMEKLNHKLFIGMVPKSLSEDELRPLLQPYGIIEDLIVLRQNGVSKGCAFVKYSSREEALNAINALNGHRLDGSPTGLVVKFADVDKTKAKTKAAPAAPAAAQQAAPNLLNQSSTIWQYAQLLASNPYLVSQLIGQTGTTGTTGTAATFYGDGGMGDGGMPKNDQLEGPPGANLFIYHLPKEFTDSDLAVTFAPFGNILSAKVFIDKQTGQSKCFGFVSYGSPDSASAAIIHMNGQSIGGKRLKVQIKKDRGSPY
eukprot:TRINITY_DN734_c0_g1_i1.p1 TRINITY_DN734_c0_g1~~TRINITY_DN734_c0_g1_i1.p1  ORF type:complete len:348 (+),score=75.32 TRINITY_DN734_c0_g1_i1:49-1092(+)